MRRGVPERSAPAVAGQAGVAPGDPQGAIVVGLLGPMRVSVAGEPVVITTGRLRALLAALAIKADQVVPAGQLAAAVWGQALPGHVSRSISTYVARLRSAIGAELIGSHPGGYRLHADPVSVDVLRFDRLLDSAAKGDLGSRRHVLGEALRLWRGEPFADLHSPLLQDVEAPRLVERYLAAVEQRVDLDLRAGGREDLVAELYELTARYPLRESLWVRLLTALQACGRPAEALARYEVIRSHLAEELGTDPCVELRRIHAQLLVAGAQDGSTASFTLALTGPPDVEQATWPRILPRQLPADVVAFTGRKRELNEISRIADSSSMVVVAVHGMPGAGKTALAVHAAHQLVGQYPDAQFFVDLHGHTDGVDPVDADDALDRILRALGVPGRQVPDHIEDRAALYRSLLAGRKTLIVLDNAGTENQVRPLLPGAPGSLVLVTSRHRLAGLDCARSVTLDALPLPDAAALFTHSVDEDRVTAAPPRLLDEVVQLCGRLPLAIRIAAARLVLHPNWSVAYLADQLREYEHRLSELQAGERGMAAALDLSYHQLTPDRQQMYRLLGLHPGTEFDAHAAAALAGENIPRTRWLLDDLLDNHLLQEPTPNRYRFHDLVRAHAAQTEPGQRHEPGVRAALTRLLNHYRGTARLAMNIAYPAERARGRPNIPPADTPTPALPDEARALAWLDTELPNLLATAQYAGDHGFSGYVVDLSAILHRHLRARGHYTEAEVLHSRAVSCALAGPGEPAALVGLGDICRLRGRHEQAMTNFERALAAARASSDLAGEVDALAGLGNIHRLQGRHELAADYFDQARAIAVSNGDSTGEMEAICGLGWIHQFHGEYEAADASFAKALGIARASGDHSGELNALRGLGWSSRMLGRYETASDYFGQGIKIARVRGDRNGEIDVLRGLAHLSWASGRYEQGEGYCQQILGMARNAGYRTSELDTLVVLGHIYRCQARFDASEECFQRALDGGREMPDPNLEFEALHGLGRLRTDAGNAGNAIHDHERALEIATDLGQPGDRARALDGLARAHIHLNEHSTARTHWRHALDILAKLGTDYTEDGDASAPAIRAALVDIGKRA